jgi:ketosteroid isomerase-like protein
VIWLAAATLLATAWGGGAQDQTGGSAADVAQIRALTCEFVLGFNSGDLDRLMSFYADDYLDVNLRKPRQTKAERREYYRKMLDLAHPRVEVTPDEIVIAGEYAFARGTIQLERTGSGQEGSSRELRYMEVLRRFPDGWKSIWGMDAEMYPEPK